MSSHASSTVLSLLSDLVACPSVNPVRPGPIESPFGETAMAALLGRLLGGWGAAIEMVEVEPGRPTVLARFAGANPARTLLLEAHTDTVQVDDMSIPPFTPTVRDGRLYGRGASDVKGPMAAMLAAIRRVLDEDGRLPVNVIFAGSCDEELGARGARALARMPGMKPDVAVVAEPTDLEIVHAHKGTIRWRIRTKGVAAHSSAPERGVNAIYHMARVLAMIEEEMIPAVREHRHPLLGSATISAGTIQGGTQVNVVPAECVLNLDRRLLPGETQDQATAEIRARLEALAVRIPTMKWSLEALQFYDPFEQPTTSPACRLVAAACEKVLGQARFAIAPWSSDAGVMAATGMPCVLFGPGSIKQAHTHDEFIEVRELERGVDVYAAIIREAALG